MIFSTGALVDNGKYRIESLIGRGGMAEVWRAERVKDKKPVAIKILMPKSLSHKTVVDRFQLEYDILAKLEHPNIVKVHDFGHYGFHAFHLPWFAMDYYPLNFRERLKQISPGEGIRLLLPILEALHYAHANKICHRDLKPMNVLVGPDDVTVLSDFGVAKELDSTRNLTQRNIIGTPTYLSPEQCTTGQVTPQSDLYTMGIIFYQLCTLKLPFDDTSDFVVIHKHKQEAPIEVQVHNPDISDELNDVIMKCLEKKPEDRPKDALELRKALLACPELKEAGQKRTLRINDIITTPKGRRYRILGLIEQGGFAEIYRVKRIDNGKIYALKILLPMHNYDSSVVKRFQREIKLLKSLDHPYILKVLDDGEYPYHSLKIPYFIMKFFPGSLSGEMNDDIDVNKAIPIIIDVLEALAHAHTSAGGVLHRDLKPSNILIGGDGHGYLADFGIAKATKDGSGLKTRNPTMTRGMLGTYAYASPEQLQEHDLGPASDIYAMGVILYELACGKRPFEAKTEAQILSMHLKERPKLPLLENPKINPKFQAVIMKCLEKSPEKRFKDVPELIEALAKAGQKEPWVGKTARVTRETMIFSAKTAMRSAAGVLGVGAAAAVFVATIGGAQVAANRMKIGAMASAMEGRGAAGTVPPAAQAPYPSIFYPEESAKKLAAIAALRGEAEKSRDVALAAKLDALSEVIWKGEVRIPELKLGGEAERVATISKKESAGSFSFAVQGAAPGATVEYAYEVLPASGDGASVKKETSAKPEFKIDGLPAPDDEQSYLLKVSAIYKDPAAGGKSYTVAMADYPDGVRLKIRKLDKPVNIAGAGANRWRFPNADPDPEKRWDNWHWLFKNLDTGEEVAAPEGSANAELVVSDEFYRSGFPSDGRYAVICEATDKSQVPQRNAESAAPTIIVDRTPPTLQAADAGKPIVLLPNESREVALKGEDALAKEGLEYYADGARTQGNALRLAWKPPARGESRRLEKVKAEAREPKGHGLELASPPVEIDVYSLSEESFDLLTSFAQSSKNLAAEGAKYARTLAMAPAAELERAIAGGSIDRDWLAEKIGDEGAFQAIRDLMKRRSDLMKLDDKFQRRMAFFHRLAASGARPEGERIVAALDAKAAGWPQSTDGDPVAYLRDIEQDIMPPPPDSAVQIEREGKQPLDRCVALSAEFLQKVDPKAQYRYVYPVEASASKAKPLNELTPVELESLLSKADTTGGGKLLLDPSADFNAYTNKHYLVIQTYLEDKENEVALKSAARAFPIEPFAPLPEGSVEKVKDYGRAIKGVQAKGVTAFPRALAWAEEHPNPLAPKSLRKMLADAKRSEKPIDEHLGTVERAMLASSDDPAKINDFLGYVEGLTQQIREEPALETPVPATTPKPAMTAESTPKATMKESPIPPSPAPSMQASPAPATPEPTPEPPPANAGQITDAEAKQMADQIAAALPRKGAGGNLKKAFQSYGSLFGAGGSVDSASDLMAKSKDRLEAINAGAAAFSQVRVAQRDPSDPDAFIITVFFNTGRNNVPLNHRVKFARAGGKLVIVKDEFIPKN